MLSEFDTLHQQDWNSLAELRSEFEWDIPDSLNATQLLCDRWVDDGNRTALIYEDETAAKDGEFTYDELATVTKRLAHYFNACGVKEGDFVAINVSRKPETIISHLATWRLGAVSIPLSVLFGPDALEHRLGETEPGVGIVDSDNINSFRTAADRVNAVDTCLVVGGSDRRSDEMKFWDTVTSSEQTRDTADTESSDPMLLLYTSGTTGAPKGIVQPHRSVLGHIPGAFVNYYNLDVRGDEVFWTPSEWAWGAFFSLMIDALYFGNQIVATETGESFDPEYELSVIQRYPITNAFFPPTALRMFKRSPATNRDYSFSNLRLVVSGGESLDAATQRWAEDYFDTTVHEGYGASEMFDHIIGDCSNLDSVSYDGIGYVFPGHRIRLLDPKTGEPVDTGEIGEIALHRSDPTLFEGYYHRPEATADSFRGDWYLSGDLATVDETGQFEFVSRKDNLIITSGYRIGPQEIEVSLIDHEAVKDASVIGVPHDTRGQVPKAFVKPAKGVTHDENLRESLRQHVRERLATYKYPREVKFVEQFPRTTTGKVKRSDLANQDPLTEN